MTIIGLRVHEGETFEVYVPGPNPYVSDPTAAYGSRTHAFKIVGGELKPIVDFGELFGSVPSGEKLHIKYISLDELERRPRIG